MDTEDGQGCRGIVKGDGSPYWKKYDEDTILEIGEKFNFTCLIKYHFINQNEIHDLRLQIY